MRYIVRIDTSQKKCEYFQSDLPDKTMQLEVTQSSSWVFISRKAVVSDFLYASENDSFMLFISLVTVKFECSLLFELYSMRSFISLKYQLIHISWNFS